MAPTLVDAGVVAGAGFLLDVDSSLITPSNGAVRRRRSSSSWHSVTLLAAKSRCTSMAFLVYQNGENVVASCARWTPVSCGAACGRGASPFHLYRSHWCRSDSADAVLLRADCRLPVRRIAHSLPTRTLCLLRGVYAPARLLHAPHCCRSLIISHALGISTADLRAATQNTHQAQKRRFSRGAACACMLPRVCLLRLLLA
jgi:hypothetical protein